MVVECYMCGIYNVYWKGIKVEWLVFVGSACEFYFEVGYVYGMKAVYNYDIELVMYCRIGCV